MTVLRTVQEYIQGKWLMFTQTAQCIHMMPLPGNVHNSVENNQESERE